MRVSKMTKSARGKWTNSALAITVAFIDVTVAVGDIAIVSSATAISMSEVLAKVLVATKELFVDTRGCVQYREATGGNDDDDTHMI